MSESLNGQAGRVRGPRNQIPWLGILGEWCVILYDDFDYGQHCGLLRGIGIKPIGPLHTSCSALLLLACLFRSQTIIIQSGE